jgi:hypothetical protein
MTAGCQSTQSIPSDITLKDALRQVREGIQELQVRPQGSKPAGLLVSEVSVVFNVAASAKNSASLGIDLAPGAVVSQVAKASAQVSSESTLSRGNQITVKFQNLLLAGKDTLVAIAVTPITTTTEKTVTKDKDTTTEKVPRTTPSPLTLEALMDLLDSKIIVAAPQ